MIRQPTSPRTSPTQYRPDIDGLRALAVLPVIAFHLTVPMLSGGFVGVDVFFVISGYLITSTLISDIHNSRFSIAKFYERRIRRILPALFVMMLITSLLAGFFFCPTDLKAFGKSLICAVLSVSNIYFWQQQGYFDTESTTKPLLHTWSLGVEEQFYIVFPLVLALLHKRVSRQLRTVVLLTAVVSLLVSVLSTTYAPASAFYLLPARAWELMTGSVLSLGMFPAIAGSARRNTMAAVGLMLILGADIFFTEATPFPGIAAVLPCAGAALLIGVGRSGDSFVSQMLSWRPVVFIGQISYSLYLWHWPLIVFQRTNGLLSNGLSHKAARLIFLPLLFVIATLSWRYVEQPFRAGGLRLRGPALFRLAAVSAAIGLALGLFFIGSDGLPGRFPAKALAVEKFLNYDPTEPFRAGTCFVTPPFDKLSIPICLTKDQHKKNYLLLGDSEAAGLWDGLSQVFPEVRFMQATASGCKPVMAAKDTSYNNGALALIENLAVSTNENRAMPCRTLMDYIYNDYLTSTRIDALVIAANWTGNDLPALSHTIDRLHERGVNVILFGPVFQYNAPLPRLLAIAIRQGQPDVHEHLSVQQEALDSEMRELAETKWHVRYISYFKVFCKQERCATYAADGVPLLFDLSHLTRDASILFAKDLRDSGDLP